MKKSITIIALLLYIIFLASFVVATPLQDISESAKSLLGTMYLSPYTMSIILLGLLLWIIIYSIVSKIGLAGKEKWNIGAATVSLIIVILSFIYLPKNFVEAIVLQYGAMGATILTIIPFAIILYFSLNISKSIFVARVTWIFYIMYYLTLFFYKIVSVENWKEAIPYGGAIIAGLIVFFALPTIRNLLFKGELEAKEEKALKDINFRKLGRKLEREETKSRTENLD